MKRLTSKAICEAASKASHINPKHLSLEFDTIERAWYWGGKAAICVDLLNTGMPTLSLWTIERWVEGWVGAVADFEEDNKITLTKYIDSIDWSVETEESSTELVM